MATRKDDTVGPWAKEKLGALGAYLGYFTKVLKNQQRWCKGTIYIDAFAGLGRTKVRSNKVRDVGGLFADISKRDDPEVAEVIDGSPRIALSIPDKFTRYVFIDRDPVRISALRSLADEFKSTHKVRIIEGDANVELQKIVNSGIEWQSHRAIVFIDPFGMQVSWSTIQALANTKAIEVLINFPLGMAIQRVLSRDGIMQAGWREALDDFFGSKDWWEQVYQTSDTLFGDTATEKQGNAGYNLLRWYCGRLEKEFGNVSHAYLVKNTRGGHLYYLVWAGPHKKGLQGADYILKMHEKVPKPRRTGRAE